ncbi:hypothetical protein [Streptomyces xanthophaeus]|uniref:hypothetical protein n=1 Tax=Streptomyces xanthophaeus TaxID=67385 RepID=UPI00264A2A31|nr:hypothetical protein [Streptomyces xanthophaeus]WKD31164.1 hypothetical protein KO717_03750 [Streptomyces xanthophaeus]
MTATRSSEPAMEPGPYDEELTSFLPRSHPADEATSATLLDHAVWGMPSSEEDVHSTAPAPSVPAPSMPASGSSLANLTAVWHGTVPALTGAPYTAGARRRRGVLRGGFLVAGATLVAALLLVRQQTGGPLSVTGVTVRPSSSTAGCDSTVTVLATIRSNGEGGTVSYRWHRSDGTVTGPVQQRIVPKARLTEVSLRWTFHGPGSVQATAVLEVQSPNRARAETTFTYTCR